VAHTRTGTRDKTYESLFDYSWTTTGIFYASNILYPMYISTNRNEALKVYDHRQLTSSIQLMHLVNKMDWSCKCPVPVISFSYELTASAQFFFQCCFLLLSFIICILYAPIHVCIQHIPSTWHKHNNLSSEDEKNFDIESMGAHPIWSFRVWKYILLLLIFILWHM